MGSTVNEQPTPAAPECFTKHELEFDDGNRLALWSLKPRVPVARRLPIVIGAGFARRMHSFSGMAMCLARNGFDVYRYDCLNHVGLSSGRIEEFRMSDALRSMRAALDWVKDTSGAPSVGLVATSLTARVAYELAAERRDIAYLVSLVGVVHLQDTLRHVFNTDHFAVPEAELPEFVTFEDKRIGALNYVRDARAGNWLTLESTVSCLQRAQTPILAFIGANDKWVSAAEVRAAFGDRPGGRRQVLEIEQVGHDVSVNASVGRSVLVRLVRAVSHLQGIELAEGDVQEPSFEQIVDQTLLEKRAQRAG